MSPVPRATNSMPVQGTPYLLSLGLSKASVAMVFLAGPISGLVVQPLIGMHLLLRFQHSLDLVLGVLADNSKSRFGRRRPYMLVGCIVCVLAMMLLGFTRPFATVFLPAKSIAVSTSTPTSPERELDTHTSSERPPYHLVSYHCSLHHRLFHQRRCV